MTAGRDRRIARMRLSSRSSSLPRRVVDFPDEITLLRVTSRRGNDRFTLHSCTQARQATLWVTIGFAERIAERFSLATEDDDDDDDKFAPQHTKKKRVQGRAARMRIF